MKGVRAVIVPVAVVLCVGGAAAAGQSVSRGARSAPGQVLETTRVVAQRLDKAVTLPGDLTPYQAVDIRAKVEGFVESIPVDRGTWVKHGQILARLSAPELRAQRAEAEAKLQAIRAQQAEAQAKMVAAQSTYDRLKAASATPGVVAGNDLDVAERTFEAAQAQVDALMKSGIAAEASVKAVSELEAYLEIVAPFDGVITERSVHPGSLVGPSAGSLLRIEQVSRLRLTVPVPETYVGAIMRGTKVDFRVSAFPDQTFQGAIARPAYSLDVKTRSMLVELDVANPRLTLAPGMYAEVRWPIARAQMSLFVPATAVVRTSERQFVVRIRNGIAEWVDVRRGEATGDVVEVFGNLREGDVVVRRGSDEIRPGTPVTAKG
ncbi:MAG: efflux RND transporter periplasmic adaptor subunit [Acidobacteria bacterium]|nr:efflux RND transporter periplasmic adaptor subunit [Acidobacteriota bacterium]